MNYLKNGFLSLAFLLAAVAAGAAAARDARPLGLTCNYAEEPLGMGDRRPSLGWRIDTGRPGYLQGAYRVLVASDRKLLEADRGDIWDSGVVREGRSQHVKFGGVPLLPRSGRFDVAYRMLTRPESPGWLHMVQSERSTMSESINQNGPGSGHHPYGAYIGFWLYKYLGGIRPDEAKPGFREFVIEPGLDSGLAEVSVGCRSLYGEIVSAWKRHDGGGTLTIRVPANTVAELILPAGAVGRNPRVNGVRLRDIPSIAPIPSSGDGKIRYSVGSGTYEFELR